ncbi:hypothetical protein PF002_g21188 [Phytophthora fragariae]|nr:hypothetical protein PF002_g21188 [Phytophthora fragariae]
MVSADLARKLKLKLSVHSPLRVSGLGGVPTKIRSKAQVKVTIGPRVVYILDLWVANIGEGIDTFLGMDFMYSAGVQICVREGLVKVPDEETILLNRGGAIRKSQGLDLAVTPDYTARFLPERSVVVQIHYAQMDPHRDVVWAGRGDRWVTKLIFASRSYSVAAKVVNISDKSLTVSFQTPIARIVERDSFPMAGRFVRPGSRKYLEWQHLIYESTFSDQLERRIDKVTQMYEDQDPPCVEKEEYGWPTRVLRRPTPESAAVRIVQKTEQDDTSSGTSKQEELNSGPEVCSDRGPDVQPFVPEEDDEDEGDFVDALEEVMSPSEVDDGDEYFDAISLDDDGVCDPPNEILEEEDDDVPVQDWPCTPLRKMELEYERCMKMNAEDLDSESTIYIHEGSELLSQLRDQLVLLPELKDLSPSCDVETADVGESGITTPDEEHKMRNILKYHRSIFLGDGNAAPAPARGVVCDLDDGDAKPVAQRSRSVTPHFSMKVYELIKKLLEKGPVEHSESPWALPIVIVLKKNGVDIRMCIDYRVVNTFIKLSNYPLPLIDDLLIGFESAMWFMSLDMASGFWAIRMTERAKLISAFVCPFGHFRWEEAEVDQDVLDFLQLECPGGGVIEEKVPALTDTMTVFQRNIPTPSPMGPVLGRSSYIDDIAHGAVSWDQLCEDLNKLLFRLRCWNISVSQPKSEFGKRSIPYLSHVISAEGIRETPKIAKGVQDLPFPNTLKGVESFLGSLNYYHKFIEDFPVVAAVLYELTDEHIRSKRDLSRAKESYEILKRKIVSTPLLRHPDRTKPFVIIPHANRWAACAVLGQEYDGVIHPVRYTGRALNDAELRYHIAEKEVIAVLRVLQVFWTLIEGCPLEVYTRYSVLKWIIQSKTADGGVFHGE